MAAAHRVRDRHARRHGVSYLQPAVPRAEADVAPVLDTPDALDIHSYAKPLDARVTHVALDLSVDFRTKRVGGTATLDLQARPGIKQIILDDKTHWICQHHGIFQGYYFFHYLGMNRDMRDAFRDHEHFEDTARFCELYDQNSFDASYDSAPLDFFEPNVRRVFAQPINSIYKAVGESG